MVKPVRAGPIASSGILEYNTSGEITYNNSVNNTVAELSSATATAQTTADNGLGRIALVGGNLYPSQRANNSSGGYLNGARPIMVTVSGKVNYYGYIEIYYGGNWIVTARLDYSAYSGSVYSTLSGTIPPNYYYSVNFDEGLYTWYEN
jgi:hypothetical protein